MFLHIMEFPEVSFKQKNLNCQIHQDMKLNAGQYRYMYLKTYAKYTFCIKFPGHVFDENFLYYCMHLASKISSYGVWNI